MTEAQLIRIGWQVWSISPHDLLGHEYGNLIRGTAIWLGRQALRTPSTRAREAVDRRKVIRGLGTQHSETTRTHDYRTVSQPSNPCRTQDIIGRDTLTH